ncbi:MAG: PKD domain-containing protein [Actinomycetota bacterium]
MRGSLFTWFHARLHADERGFTLVEGMVAGMILAVGAFAVAQALGYGLTTSGLARERLAAQAGAEEQMEFARSLNYEALALNQDSLVGGEVPHSANESNPDFWVDEDAQTYNPTGAACVGGGSTCYEPLIVTPEEPGTPQLTHVQDPFSRGNTEFEVYVYVTWVDLDDGGSTEDLKRVTAVVTWDNPKPFARQIKISSLFSNGEVPYVVPESSTNQGPSVGCPDITANALTVNLTASASDTDGTIDRIDWEFGDGNSVTDGGVDQQHTYAGVGTYQISNTVYDDDGATASNAGANCTVTVSTAGGGGNGGPNGTISILNGQDYTTSTQVTLNLSSAGATQMQLSTDGLTWGAALTYATSPLYTLTSGDGTKTVYVRFIDSLGKHGATASDSILLDTGSPTATPTGLIGERAQNNLSAVLNWTAPSPLPSDFGGYLVYQRATTPPNLPYSQVTCVTEGSPQPKCRVSGLNNQTDYQFYVVVQDLAGNIGGASNVVSV